MVFIHKKEYHNGKQVMHLLLILILLTTNFNFIYATTIRPIINDITNDVINSQLGSDLQSLINFSAGTKTDYIFKDRHNSRANFTLPKIPIFQVIPEIQWSDENYSKWDLSFYFKVKKLHIVTIDKQWTGQEIYSPKNYNYGGSKEFHELNVTFSNYQRENFSGLNINKISTGFWDESRSGSIIIDSTDLKITFDQIFNRVILQHQHTCNKQGVAVTGIKYIIFDLFDSPDNIQLSVEHHHLTGKVILKLNSLIENKNRIGFNPPGLLFPKSTVPGQLHEQIDRQFIFTKNFSAHELNFEEIFFLEPLTCPTIENNFVLQLKFQVDETNIIENLEKNLLTELDSKTKTNSNTWVADVACEHGKTQWVFKNNYSDIFVDKIYFDLVNNKVWLVKNKFV